MIKTVAYLDCGLCRDALELLFQNGDGHLVY